MKITNIRWFAPKIGPRCRFIVKVETDAGIYGFSACPFDEQRSRDLVGGDHALL